MVPISVDVPVQVAMDRMKKIKRQLSMTLRGGRGIDKTNGVPEQIGLDESGGGGGSDLGEAPTRVAPGELRSVRGPLSSAPGGSTLIIYPPCPSPQILPLRLLSSFSLLRSHPFLTHSICTSLTVSRPQDREEYLGYSAVPRLSAFFSTLCWWPSQSHWICLLRAFGNACHH